MIFLAGYTNQFSKLSSWGSSRLFFSGFDMLLLLLKLWPVNWLIEMLDHMLGILLTLQQLMMGLWQETALMLLQLKL